MSNITLGGAGFVLCILYITPSDLSFTITKQTQISDITGSIHDPDGSYAVINDNSGVIYKIQRTKPAPSNVLLDIRIIWVVFRIN